MELAQLLNDELAAVVAQVRRGLVQIWNKDGSIGAGTVWRSDGLIVTNAHVAVDGRVGRRRELFVRLEDGRLLPAALLAYDTASDLAALSIEADHLPTINPGDSRLLRPGNWVMALGHPWGVIDALTAGIVIDMGVNLPERADGREWIALSLKLRPGHSGGPLMNSQGEVVGINTMIAGPEVGFAIPVHLVQQFLQDHTGQTPPPVEEALPEPEEIDVIII